MNSYISTAAEAAAIREGRQTVIVSMVKPQPGYIHWNTIQVGKSCGWADEHGRQVKPPFLIGKPVYIRETIYELGHLYTGSFDETGEYSTIWVSKGIFVSEKPNESHRVISAATMPKSAARTWFTPVKVECKRVQEVDSNLAEEIVECKSQPTGGDDNYIYYRDYLGGNNEAGWLWFGEMKDGALKSFRSYIISKYGQSAWDSNAWVFLTTVELKK